MKTEPRYIMIMGFITLLALFMGACSRPVLRQDIPVSTNPLGAKIYANGELVGSTPKTVSLERNRSHVLTLVKENYRQEDVVITNQYQKEKVYLKAIQSGLHSGLFFGSSAMGVNSGMNSVAAQEESGEAFILSPPAVTITLTPLTGPPTPSGPSGGRSAQPPLADTQAPPMGDREMAKELLKIGVGAGAAGMAPIEKKVETSSSEKNYVTADGTKVQEKSGTSVGVGVNPAGLVDAIDTLFK